MNLSIISETHRFNAQPLFKWNQVSLYFTHGVEICGGGGSMEVVVSLNSDQLPISAQKNEWSWVRGAASDKNIGIIKNSWNTVSQTFFKSSCYDGLNCFRQQYRYNIQGNAYYSISYYTVETLYNTINFCWSTHKRHSIARPKGRGVGCLLWVQRATFSVDLSILSSIKYLL